MRFAVESSVVSSLTQNTFERALNEVWNGIFTNQNKWFNRCVIFIKSGWLHREHCTVMYQREKLKLFTQNKKRIISNTFTGNRWGWAKRRSLSTEHFICLLVFPIATRTILLLCAQLHGQNDENATPSVALKEFLLKKWSSGGYFITWPLTPTVAFQHSHLHIKSL